MLRIEGLTVRHGAVEAVKGIDLEISAGEVVALVGANGAGKTSTVKAIAGLLPHGGRVLLDGTPLAGGAEAVLRRGVALVPEGRGVLGRMSVEDNLLMGAYARADRRTARAEMEAQMERFPILRERRAAPAGLLSGGEQQLLAIARSLLARPRLLMLDEPSLGLAPIMVAGIFDLVRGLRRDGLTVLLIEQKALQLSGLADRAYLLESGIVRASGSIAELAGGTLLTDSFLGASSL